MRRQKNFKVLAGFLGAASEPNRLKILCLVFDSKKTCVSRIALSVGLSVADASHHLRALAKAGLLRPAREGRRVCYQPARLAFVSDLKKFICKYK